MIERLRERPTIEQEGRELVERLGGRWAPSGGMCRCPAHDDRTPSLSVRPGRSRLLLHCFAGCDVSTILRALEAGRHLRFGTAAVDAPPLDRADRRRDAAAQALWNASRPLPGTPAEAYLKSRGLRVGSAELRYHARTPHGPAPLTLFRPALIAAVRDRSALVAVHRTFLDLAGSGLARPSPRCGLGRFGTGCVQLGGTAARLGLAEGIETALSATVLFNVPCWATLGTERFARVGLPPEVRELVLFLDHDAGGRRAEALAREAFAAIERIDVCRPARAGDDWNDVLRRRSQPSD